MKGIELTHTNPNDIKKIVNGKYPVLMLYKMHGCPHCVALEPAWKSVKSELEKVDGIQCAEVEYRNMDMLPPALHVSGFPVIQVIEKGGVKAEYSGDRSSGSILLFASSFVVPPKPKSKSVAKPKSQPSSAAAKPKPKPKKKEAA